MCCQRQHMEACWTSFGQQPIEIMVLPVRIPHCPLILAKEKISNNFHMDWVKAKVLHFLFLWLGMSRLAAQVREISVSEVKAKQDR